jgi:hypothetical protein
MKKIVQLLLYPVLALVAMFYAYSALAEAPGAEPLVILRFNQERVYYEQPLFQAIAKAVAIKPEVMFDVVSFAPLTGSAAADAKWLNTASAHTQKVVASMQAMGVPLSRMRISGQRQMGLTADEVHIFVR